MNLRKLSLIALDGSFAIVRLDPDVPIPVWACTKGFCSITRTSEELSIVVHEINLPEDVGGDRGWRCWRIAGTFDLANETGVVASVASPLAEAKVGLFVVSTYDTDYVLIKSERAAQAADVLRAAGHTVD